MKFILFGWIALCGILTLEADTMDAIHEKIANAVQKEHDWKKDQIRIDAEQDLNHGSCSFYAVRHTVRPLSYVLNYAVLSGETVLSDSDEQAASKILSACGSDASAVWWAEVLTRFHDEVGAGIVLQNTTQNVGAIDQIKAAKREFTPPKFSEDSTGKSVTFYLLEPEEFIVYFVKATRQKDNMITVNKAAV
jgi:hypothetical protein